MANNFRWYGHILRREDGHVLRIALAFEVEDQRKKDRSRKTWKKQVKKECVGWFKKGRCILWIKLECWR